MLQEKGLKCKLEWLERNTKMARAQIRTKELERSTYGLERKKAQAQYNWD